MSCDGEPPSMRFVDGRLGFRPGHVCGKLERRDAFPGPILDHAARVLGPAEHVKLGQRITLPLDNGARYMHLGADQSSSVDLPLDFQIRVGLKRGSRADCRNAVREKQPRIAEWHFVSEHVIGVEKVAQIKKMAVHVDESGKRRVSGKVDPLRARRNVDRAGRSEGGNAAAGYENRLVLLCRRSGAVNDRGVLKGNNGRRYANKFFPSREALRRNRWQQFVHFAEAAVPTALVLTAGFLISKAGLSQDNVGSRSPRQKLYADLGVARRACERAVLIPLPSEDEFLRRTHFAKRSVQIVEFFLRNKAKAETASGASFKRRRLRPMGLVGGQEPLGHGSRVRP